MLGCLVDSIDHLLAAPVEHVEKSDFATEQSVVALVTSRVANEAEARERGQRKLGNALETARQEAAEATRRVKDELREHRNANTRVPMDVAALRRDVDSLQTLVQSTGKQKDTQLGKQQAKILLNRLDDSCNPRSIWPEIYCILG